MSEFDPKQLDQLEDALDALDDPRSIDELRQTLGLDEQVADRLAAYRHVTAHAREALVDEPAPLDALARAMAAAQAEATGVLAPLPDVERPEPSAADVRGGWQRWWKRWRAGLIPLAALGGTAALVLWIVRPEGTPQLARADAEAEQQPARPTPLETEAASLERADAEAGAEDEAEAAAEPTPSTAKTAEDAAAVPSPAPAKKQAVDAPKARPGKEENIAGPDGSYAEQPAIDTEDPKGQLYERLEQAHAQRRKGNCVGAVSRYEQLLGQPDLDALQRARAEAGLGLCREFMGQTGKSDAHFGRAQAQDPTIDGWISRERTKTAPAPENKQRKSKRKAAAQSSESL